MTNSQEQKQARIALASYQQNQASEPQSSVWVEASAGTGKTKVLTDRVLRLLLDGANPANILCLTYTKAAASEMSNRIIDRLSEWAVIDETSLIAKLENLLNHPLTNQSATAKIIARARRLFTILLDTPDGIKIQTIHSFCQEILKRFPLEAGVSPYFEVMDERETTEILQQIKQDILTKEKTPLVWQALQYLTAHTSEYTFPTILSSITAHRNELENYFSRYDDINQAVAAINRSLNLTSDITEENIITDFWDNFLKSDWQYIVTSLNAGSNVSIATASSLTNAVQERNFTALTKALLTSKTEPNKKFFVKKSLNDYPDSLTHYDVICQMVTQTLQRLRDVNLRDSTVAVLTLAGELLSRFQNYKTARAKMDYNDLIIKTVQLLSTSSGAEWVLYKLDSGIDHILIDEAQDTSPEQWQIIQALTKEFFAGKGSKNITQSIFVVGDSKQSIYSFQGADVAEFKAQHQYFQSNVPHFKTINMDVSFRSTAAILDMVNAVFTNPLAAGGVTSETRLNHEPSRIGEGGHVEIWPITYATSDNTSDDIWLPPIERLTAQSASSILAQKIAATILHKVKSGERKANGEPLRFKDFLILVQRRNSLVDEIVRACKNASVAIAGVDKIKLLEQIAVKDLLAAARFVLLPDDDLNLACLLKSPLFGLDDDDLFTLCYERKASLWQQIKLDNRYQPTCNILQEILTLGQDTRPYEFFAYLLITLNGRQKFISRLTSECEDAIDEFINLTLSFEQEHIPSLQVFVEWMQSDEVEVKRNLEQNELDAVRLMTVHGAKGLQSPVVILPDTVRVKSVKQEAGLLIDNQKLFYPLGKDYYNQNCTDIQTQTQTLSQEEYNRLLYVALTRAGEQLYICGYSNSREPQAQSWYNLCREYLARIAPLNDDGIISYHLNSEKPLEVSDTNIIVPDFTEAPTWLYSPATPESALTKPLTPSHQDEQSVAAVSPLLKIDNSGIYQRGNIIHKLLQFIPTKDTEERLPAVQAYLDIAAVNISVVEREKIAAEVLNLLNSPQYTPLFSRDSRAEVAIMGVVGERVISGKIDRLVVTDDKVMIVDYKTNRPAARNLSEVPLAYFKQMQAYRELIAKIYPNKTIESYILWTNTAEMMRIN